MTEFFAGFKNTHTKTWLRWKYRIYAMLVFVIAIYSAITAYYGRTVGLSGTTFSMMGNPYSMLEMLNLLWVPLVGFMLAADYFATEFSDGSIKFEVMRPIGRPTLYFSKLTAILVYMVELYAISLLVHIVLAAITGNIATIGTQIVTTLMSALVALAFASFSCFLSTLLGHPSLSMFVMILLYAAMLFVGRVFLQFGVFFFTSSVNWYKMVLGSQVPWTNFFSSLALILATIGITTGFGQWIFDKKDFG